LLDSPDTADPGSQLRTQQARIGGLVSQSAHGCKLLVDSIGSQTDLADEVFGDDNSA
jgi:hypothetical protein